MPRDKDLKRVIRARMQKTGESYTTARAHILRKQSRRTAEPPTDGPVDVDRAAVPPPAVAAAPGAAGPTAVTSRPDVAADYATVAGMADAALVKQTGRTWAEWVDLLDAENAAALPHGEIATIVHGKYGVPDWWSQSVTVGYERIRGLRERGQRRSGEYEAARSRTFHVDVATLFRACADDAMRTQWLGGVDTRVRTARPARSVRLDWPDGTRVVLWLTAKSEAKSSVSVQHEKLPDRETAERLRQFWAERLDALGELLAS